MQKTAVVALVAIAVLVGLLSGAWGLLAPYMSSRKPDQVTGPLEVAVRELSLAHPSGVELPPMAVRVWAPQSAGNSVSYPLIIYVPGWGGSRGENDVLLSNIASTGFVVAAADDVGRDKPDPATDPADEAVRTSSFRAYSPQDLAAFPEVSERRTRLGYDKVVRLISALTRLRSKAIPSAIDVSRIGVVGYSFGGAVAAVTLARDPRVAAAVNLDGWVVDTPAAAGVSRPYLALYAKMDLQPPSRRVYTPNDYETELAREDFRVLLALSRSSGSEVRLIDGVEHQDFTDMRYVNRWKRWRPWRREIIRPDRMRAIMEAYLIPFLHRHVSGTPWTAPIHADFLEVSSIESIERDLR